MKKLKHLHPAMEHFVFHKIPEFYRPIKSIFYTLKDNYIVAVIFHGLYFLLKLFVLDLPIIGDLIWIGIVGAVLFCGVLLVRRKVTDDRISYIAHMFLSLLGLCLSIIYLLWSIVLTYFDLLYLIWVILPVLGIVILCSHYWVRHCLVWDKYGTDSPKQSKFGSGLWVGLSCIITIIMMVVLRVSQDNMATIIVGATAFGCIILIAFILPFTVIYALKLYYYYKYLRAANE